MGGPGAGTPNHPRHYGSPGRKPHDPGTAGRSNRHPPSGYQPAGTWYGDTIASHLETACGWRGHDAEDRVCAQRISKHKFNKNTKTHRKPPAHTRRRLRLSKSPVQPTCADGRDTYREI